jgi:hypothetical protein
MKRNKVRVLRIATLLLIPLCVAITIAQQHRENRGGGFSGIVLDQQSLKPMEFATVTVHSGQDNKPLTGATTNASGEFTINGLRTGSYFVRISFIGFEQHQSKHITITDESMIGLGKIYLRGKDIGMRDVVVKADRIPISYQIDKKIINVSENITSLSGTAVDVLENVPSVTVDIDGNVSLRGSGNFTVLIDGRPTILDANIALQQIPAGSVDNIEIITNPSAKFDPEGTAGIINVVLKKQSKNGISGIAGLNTGLRNKYGAELLTDYKNNNTQLNFGLNYNRRTMTSSEIGRNWTKDGSLYSYYNSDGTSLRRNDHFGLRGSLAWELGEKKTLSVGGTYRDRKSLDHTSSNYSEWTSTNNAQQQLSSLNEGARDGGEYQLSASYTHPFTNNGHELAIEVDYEVEDGTDVTINNLMNGFQIVDGKRASESGPGSELTSKLDYQVPFGEDSKFEAGYQGERQLSDEITGLDIYNPVTMSFENAPLFSNAITYITNQYALYSIFSSKTGGFGYKVGVRGEYTGRNVVIEAKDQKFSLDKWDYFPTMHLSYNFGSGNQMMSSYTRRINRPHGWEFEPFLTWIDAYNVRIGNPSILPEYIDSYELGIQKVIGKSVISFESYYRVTNNKIDRIRSFYSENVTLQTPQNIGRDYALGAESFFNFDPVERWNMNLMGNVYQYRIAGQLNESDFGRTSFNWNVRINNTLKMGPGTMIQLNAMYNSPTVSAQGKREGYISNTIAIKQNFFDVLTATLQIRDVFSSATSESTNESFDFYNYRYAKRESPVVMLNLRFNINNYTNDERDNGEEPMEGG